jgi:hypothetical protein
MTFMIQVLALVGITSSTTVHTTTSSVTTTDSKLSINYNLSMN